MIKYCILGLAASAMVAGSAHAKTNIANIGDWRVYQFVNDMTDIKSCVAHFKEARVQLTDDSLSLGYRGIGGVSGYTIRLDNQKAWDMALPTKIEKQVSAIVIDGSRFDQIKQANRVRVQTLTVLNSLKNDDIDLSDKDKVFAVLNGDQCKGVATFGTS